MKNRRLLSLVLVLLTLLSLFAMLSCSSENAQSPNTADSVDNYDSIETSDPEPSTIDEPNDTEDYSSLPVSAYHGKSCPELIEEGISPLIGITAPLLSDEYLIVMIGSLQEQLEAQGFSTMAMSAENNISTQIEQVENFITMGAVCIIEAAIDIDSLSACNETAREAGIIVTCLGAQPLNHEIDGGIATDWEQLGIAAAEQIIAYLDYTYPDDPNVSIKTAFSQNSSLSRPKICSENMRSTLETDPRINIIFEKDLVMEIDTGFTFAEEALTYDPEITLFAMYIDASAVGANNYLASLPDVDFSNYAIFCTNGGDTWRELLAMSATNESAIRGSICYGGADPAAGLFETAYKMLMGEESSPYWIYEQFWAENCFGWEYNG